MTADQLIARFLAYTQLYDNRAPLPESYKQAVWHILEDACNREADRAAVLAQLTLGKHHARHELSEAQWYALSMFVAPVRATTPAGGWVTNHGDGRLAFMCLLLIEAAAEQAAKPKTKTKRAEPLHLLKGEQLSLL